MQDQEKRDASTLEEQSAPRPRRPQLPKEYGVPVGEERMLPWSWAVERLEKARNYWICTVRPDGKPHAVPVWAAWMDGTLYFDGHPMTRWGRNLSENPAVSLHLESGDEVVIIEGEVEDIAQLDRERAERLASIFASKYEYAPSADDWVERGLYALRPAVAFAWSEFPATLTRWRFQEE